jgi:hypothetical protein
LGASEINIKAKWYDEAPPPQNDAAKRPQQALRALSLFGAHPLFLIVNRVIELISPSIPS